MNTYLITIACKRKDVTNSSTTGLAFIKDLHGAVVTLFGEPRMLEATPTAEFVSFVIQSEEKAPRVVNMLKTGVSGNAVDFKTKAIATPIANGDKVCAFQIGEESYLDGYSVLHTFLKRENVVIDYLSNTH